jgi:uncharacterized damage-inducible protein DinB
MTYYGAAELARSVRTVRGNTIKMAEEIPEEQYDFRPTPESRSVKEILVHIVATSQRNYQGHAVRQVKTFVGVDYAAMTRELAEQAQLLAKLPKAELIGLLRENGEQWGAYLDHVTEEQLSVIVPFSPPAVPPAKSRFEMLLSVKEHEMHHRAQLMVYQRLLGLVPHLTRERQTRMAPTAAGSGSRP